MLTETFVASTLATAKNPPDSTLPKDASIFLHDLQPTKILKGYFNQSITEKNCLVITQTHIFAAQADRAIVKVFSREKGNLETFVAFHEHISSLSCIEPDDGASILVLGTNQGKASKGDAGGGRLMLWEVCTGRIVQTETSHIQPITSLVVDVTNNYILSGSADSQIHVWSVPALLSFTELDESDQHSRSSPLHTLTGHDAGITAITTGHSHMPVDLAVSASLDKRCNVWDYRAGTLLHTFLVGESPLCLSMDPIDRGFYAGLSDGAVQLINFHKLGDKVHPLYDERHHSKLTEAPIADRWKAEGYENSPVCSIDVSYDGTIVLAGHESGIVSAWNANAPHTPSLVANLAQPVTNLRMLPPTGFPAERKTRSRLNSSMTKLSAVVKPRLDTAVSRPESSGLYVPDNYTLSACFVDQLVPARFRDEHGMDTLLTDFERDTEPETSDLPDDVWSLALRDIAVNQGTSSQTNGDLGDDDRLLHDKYIQTQVKLKLAHLQQKAMVEQIMDLQKQLAERGISVANGEENNESEEDKDMHEDLREI